MINDQQKTIQDQNKKIAALEANSSSNDKKISALQKELDEIKRLLQR